jgi:hypothetical protein
MQAIRLLFLLLYIHYIVKATVFEDYLLLLCISEVPLDQLVRKSVLLACVLSFLPFNFQTVIIMGLYLAVVMTD